MSPSTTSRLLTLGTLLLTMSAAPAQNFAVDRFVLSGGGGTSTNGAFSLTGTVGQPDAGQMVGGSYALAGGFHSVALAIQTPGAPLLKITRAGNTFILTWPVASVDFVLEETPSFTPRNWQAVATAFVINGAEFQVTVPAVPGTRYYRLRLP